MNELWYNSLIFEKWENTRTHVGVVLEVFPDGSFITEEWYE